MICDALRSARTLLKANSSMDVFHVSNSTNAYMGVFLNCTNGNKSLKASHLRSARVVKKL